jgi:hypothetical protein
MTELYRSININRKKNPGLFESSLPDTTKLGGKEKIPEHTVF